MPALRVVPALRRRLAGLLTSVFSISPSSPACSLCSRRPGAALPARPVQPPRPHRPQVSWSTAQSRVSPVQSRRCAPRRCGVNRLRPLTNSSPSSGSAFSPCLQLRSPPSCPLGLTVVPDATIADAAARALLWVAGWPARRARRAGAGLLAKALD